MSQENPLVSIIVPSYNHEKYISECIESIVNQTYKNIELIVVDDGSIDNSRAIIAELQQLHRFIMIFQENQGLAKTLTHIIKDKCNGKYISICASDDYWDVNKVKEQVSFLEDHPDYPMCFSKCYYINQESQILKNGFHYETEREFKSGNLFEDLFLLRYHLPVSYMYTKKVLEEVGYFPEGIYCEDYYMNLKISEKYPIGYIDKYLIHYRFQINSELKTVKIINSQRQIIDQYVTNDIYPQALRNWKLRALRSYTYYPKLKHRSIIFLFDVNLASDWTYWKSILKFLFKWQFSLKRSY